MASEPRNDHVPEWLDPDTSPFELPPLEGLPLTRAERATLERIIREFDEERAAASARRP